MIPPSDISQIPDVIGVISDTHGLLRPEALLALAGSDLIIHAGDIGNEKILEQLRSLAPVIAVRGNVDTSPWALKLPLTAVVETRAGRIYVLHDLEQLDLDPAAAGFRIIISGHSHKPDNEEHAGIMYLNPGSAGPRRFHLPIMLARLHAGVSPPTIQFIDLEAVKL